MVYYFGCEGITESFTSKFSIFFIIIGIGVNINIIYLMIELRVTADKLGSTILIIITASMIISKFASVAAYSEVPLPFFAGISMFVIALTFSQFLPAPIKDDQYLESK